VERRWHTVVVDTVDAYQRLCKEDYLQAHRGLESFGGRDAWGYLEAKMSQLLTRLNALDMNVIVNAHYKATGDDDDGGKEVTLQLQGSVKFSLFGDFSLIGRTQAFYADADGDRVRKFGITFRSSEEWPFLRDRLRITPTGWMEITFSEEDWGKLFATYIERAEMLKPGQVLEVGQEIQPPAVGEGGPVAVAPQAELPLTALDRSSLVSLARGLGLPVRGNSTKGDLVDAIQKHRLLQEDENKIKVASHDEAVATVVQELGAEVTSDYTVGQGTKKEPAETKEEPAETKTEVARVSNGQLRCAGEGCDKVLNKGDASVTKSRMKEWPPLCEQHYGERKKAKA
jgi:hypothetical protein